ncbi:hypothetical protein AB4865_01010 [Capnocytophaga sp. ARDL2]
MKKKEPSIPEWHKSIFDEDLASLENDLIKNDNQNNVSWKELKREIKLLL